MYPSRARGTTMDLSLPGRMKPKSGKMASAHSSLFGFSRFFFWLLLLTRVDAQNRSSEVQVLLRFKDAMTVDSQQPFIDLTAGFGGKGVETANSRGYWSSWNATDENPCAWVGVICTENYTVGQLDLSSWGLWSGWSSVDAILSHLPDLRYLDVSSNSLDNNGDSNVPVSLTRLTYLDMSNNEFIGEIPSHISALTSLRYLSLAENLLTGEIPSLDGLTNLQVLLLGQNGLSGQLPKQLGEMSSLVHVDLSGNMLNGTIPTLSKATKLLHLDLDNNWFTEFDPQFPAGSESLEYLSVSGNQLAGTIPQNIANLQNLEYLDLSQNNFSGSIPFGFVGPNSTFSLDFSQNQLSGNIPTDILQPRSLVCSINLSYNFLSGHIPSLQKIYNYTTYNVLDLSHNNLTGPFPSSYSQNMVLSLYLQSNNLSGDIVDVLWRYNTTKQMFPPTCSQSCNVSYTYFGNGSRDPWFNTSCTAPCEESVYYSSSPFHEYHCTVQSNNTTVCLNTTTTIYSDYTPCNDAGFSSAWALRLDDNSFTGDLSRLANFSICWYNLQVLDLSGNYLQMTTTEANPDPLRTAIYFFTYGGGSTPSLTDLRAGRNNFSGTSLPAPSFGANETQLQVLDLSSSHLKGEISGAVFNSGWLPLLQVLNLSCNFITGGVPGEIITLLPNLVALNISNNKFTGPLPLIPPNSLLYNPGFFLGNDGLCGGPLPPCQSKRTGVPWWVLVLVVGGSVIILVGVCLAAIWQWRKYHKLHQQDADLIQTLLERESTALMPLRELKRATNNFSQSSQIGEGGFGTVYKGQLDDKTMVAIKRSKREGSDQDKGQFLNEVKILSQLNHRHLVKLLGCCLANKIALLVFEFVSNGTLRDHLYGKSGATRLNWKVRLDIAVQTADALNYLHSSATISILHRDVKSANILLDDDLNAKVSDFGISKLAPSHATHVSTAIQGTIGYMDPAIYTSCQFSGKSDVYSFGVVLLELISAKRAIDFQRGEEEASLVLFAKKYIESEDLQQLIDPALMDTYSEPAGLGRKSILQVGRLALKCLKKRPKARPSMEEVGRELQNLRLQFSSPSEDNNDSEDDAITFDLSAIISARTSPSPNHRSRHISLQKAVLSSLYDEDDSSRI